MESLTRYDIIIDGNHTESKIQETMKQLRPSWDSKTTKIKLMTQGLSNRMYKVSQEADVDDGDAVMFRIHGQEIERLIDRREATWIARVLDVAGIGAKVYALFTNGIIHEYLPGSPPTSEQTKNKSMLRSIAHEIARVHSLDPNSYSTPGDSRTVSLSRKPGLIDRFHKLIKQLPDDLSTIGTNIKPAVEKRIVLEEEFRFIEPYFRDLDCEIVFNHGDVAPSNLIYNERQGKLTLIDAELGAFDFFVLDLLMFIQIEGSGLVQGTFTFENMMSKEKQLEFIEMYFRARNEISPNSIVITPENTEKAYEQMHLIRLLFLLTFAVLNYVLGDRTVNGMNFIWLGNVDIEEYFKIKEYFLKTKWKYITNG